MNHEGFHWRAVLGVDAAWTVTEPSGVAAAVETASGWRLAAVAASYEQFIARANGVEPGGERPRGSKPSAADLLDAAWRICGRRVDLVAVDMPMARHPIVGRRPSDNAISSNYGAKRAATTAGAKDSANQRDSLRELAELHTNLNSAQTRLDRVTLASAMNSSRRAGTLPLHLIYLRAAPLNSRFRGETAARDGAAGPWPKTCVKGCARSRSGENGRRLP